MWLVGIIVILLVFPLLLYLVVAIIVGEWITRDHDSRPVYVILSILAIAIWVTYPLYGQSVAAIVTIFCGILFSLLAAWHLRIAMQDN